MYRPMCLLLFLIHNCCGVIYYLNDTEYKRMPPIYHIDNYEDCFTSPSSVYCNVHFDLVTNEPSELLYVIEEYSQHFLTHYNHTKLRYGLCVTENCQHIRTNTLVSKHSLEECLNISMWKNYNLKTKVTNYKCYNQSDNNVQVDAADATVGLVLLSLFLLNIIASIYDRCSKKSTGNSYLLSFSMQRNWTKLTSRTEVDPLSQRFKGIDAIRCLILYGVIYVHCFWAYLVAVKNSHDLELMYYNLPLHLFFNGSTVMQAFFVLSGFFLTYKINVQSETKQVNWTLVPSSILLRYLRLAPAYAVVIALMATWLKFSGPSALWEVSGEPAFMDCRNRWWLPLLYLNNYVYNTQCMVQGWYVALDMQLYCLGLVLCVFLTNARRRKIILSTVFIIGLIIPGIHTYLRDLHALMLLIPGETRYLFVTDRTFNEVYKMTHDNIPGYIIGMSLGYLVYRWQHAEIDINKFKKFRILYWALLPLLLAIVVSGSVFYRDAPRDPLYIRVLYAIFAKPMFGLGIAFFVCGLIFRIENIYSTFLGANAWYVPSKLCYCVYINHFLILRIHVSMNSHLLYITSYHLFLMTTIITVMSLMFAVPLWMFVEAPFTELSKCLIRPRKEKKLLGEHQGKNNIDTHL